MWLVRDFNLKLVDQDGAAITTKEYLEFALSEQSGMSERTEAKNRTRRLFKSLFTERDCITFDRPVNEEKDLHTLADIPTERLRQSFIRQVELLRKRTIGKIRPKTLNGTPITGRVLVNLAQQYVEAFNTGAVPNIENAWTYICRNENQRALQKAQSLFESLINSKVELPCTYEALIHEYKLAKHVA